MGNTEIRHREEYLESIRAELKDAPPQLKERDEEIAQAAFRVLARHLDWGEVQKIQEALPKRCALCGPSTHDVKSKMSWRKNTTVYQIYPRSFSDSNGDGIGDLQRVRWRTICSRGACQSV